jgi:quercetin dioxygenase-like cupin family protein
METQPYKLVDMVNYQDGSVVSRTLVNRKGGTLTLFAFDAGQSFSEHTAPFDTVAEILDGEADIAIAGQQFHLRAGEIIIMPANQPHAVNAPQKSKMLLTMIKE